MSKKQKTKAVDIKKWWKTIGRKEREFDILMSKKILGLSVVGWADCSWASEGIIQKKEKETLPDPVYVTKCVCKEWDKHYKKTKIPQHITENLISEKKFLGHYGYCLGELPHYSTNVRDAWRIVNKLKDSADFQIVCQDNEWSCAFGGSWRCEAKAKTAELAICHAALKFKRNK